MDMDAEKKRMLEEKARRIRYLTVDEIGTLGVGHIGGCLSVAEVLSVLYFDVMNIDPQNPKMESRDRLVLSKGHAGPALYAALAEKGFFDISLLHTLNIPGTSLPSHCDMLKTPGVDMTAGSLGQGISCAVGMAMAARMRGGHSYVYCIIGDGESQEGQVWEASMMASQQKLDNLIVFLDYNNMQIDGLVDNINSLRGPAERWSAFGFDTYDINGHDVAAIEDAILSAKQKKGAPSLIVLRTVKGKGVSFVEKAGAGCHNMNLTKEQTQQALGELINEEVQM